MYPFVNVVYHLLFFYLRWLGIRRNMLCSFNRIIQLINDVASDVSVSGVAGLDF